MELQNFDITSYLKTKGITVHTAGKNVQEGWIGIKCLWCGDQSNHLGINLHSKIMKCWKCKVTGPATRIVQKLEHCSSDEAEDIAERFFEYYIQEKKDEWKCSIKPEEVIPKYASENPLQIHVDYLKHRNFDPFEIKRKYKILFTDHHAERNMKWRILIPIIMDRQIIGWTARDVTGKAELRYKSSDLDKYLVNPDTILYNFDTVYHTAFIVEGPTDVWRLGEGSCAPLGTEFNNYHVNAFIMRGIQRAFLIFDPEPEAQKLAHKMAAMLEVVIPQVEIITLEKGDPGDLSPKEALQLKEELLK